MCDRQSFQVYLAIAGTFKVSLPLIGTSETSHRDWAQWPHDDMSSSLWNLSLLIRQKSLTVSGDTRPAASW